MNFILTIIAAFSFFTAALLVPPVEEVIEECNQFYQTQFELACSHFIPTTYEIIDANLTNFTTIIVT